MKVRVKKGITYGWHGTPKRHSDGPFEISVEEFRARNLLTRGIVDIVDGAPLPTVEPAEETPSPVLTPEVETPVAESVDYESLTLVQLREECAKRGIEYTSKTRKAALIELLENA